MSSETIVLKFGSSVLQTTADIPRVVSEIYREHRQSRRVLAVVSAIGDTTDCLMAEALAFSDMTPDEIATAELLSGGERHAAALVTLALRRTGLRVRNMDPREIRLTASGERLNASLSSVDRGVIEQAFEEADVLIVPGCGSDLSAAFLAHALEADACRLLKDVDGLYERDPALVGPTPDRFQRVSAEDALALGGELIQPKAVTALTAFRGTASIAATGYGHATVLCDQSETAAPIRTRPLRVGLVGCGTVGRGVFDLLTARPEQFQVTGIAVRDPARRRCTEIPDLLLRDHWEAVLADRPDVLVELMGGVVEADVLCSTALARGIHVVTANKALLADRGRDLNAIADGSGAALRFSAAVGGGVPMLETVRRAREQRRITSIRAVLNGTCNFVLERLADHGDLDQAILEAQQRGYAEADPSLDLDGTDAAQKLVLLIREAFGRELSIDQIEVVSDPGTWAKATHQASRRGAVVRLVASASAIGGSVRARVGLAEFETDHPFAQLSGAGNGILVETSDRVRHAAYGVGAGRWPTAEAVVADLADLWRAGAYEVETTPRLRTVTGGAA
jgi:homoserine dehydrogenase